MILKVLFNDMILKVVFTKGPLLEHQYGTRLSSRETTSPEISSQQTLVRKAHSQISKYEIQSNVESM